MRYLAYIILLYVFLPFNFFIDLIAIVVFFVIYNESAIFAIIFSFLAGLLIDLYNPGNLGLHMLTYMILSQTLLYVKKYINEGIPPLIMTFIIFYLFKTIIVGLVLNSPLIVRTPAITILAFLPLSLFLNKLLYGAWKKI